MNEHDIDRVLTGAGARLRADAPDPVASRRALDTARHHRLTAGAPRRNWWPTAIGIGLAAAAAVGVFAYNSIDTDETVELVPAAPSTVPDTTVAVTTAPPEPATTVAPDTTGVPMTTLAPEVSVPTVDGVVAGDATVVTTADGRCVELRFLTVSVSTVGCADRLDAERPYFTASGGQAYLLTEAERQADGQRVLTADPIGDGDPILCGLRPADLTGRIVYVAACNDTAATAVALGARLPVDPDAPTTYFVTPYAGPDSVELGAPSLVDGDLVVLTGDGPPSIASAACLVVVSTASGEWRESCRLPGETEPASMITTIDGAVVQIDVDGPTVEIHRLDRWAPPSSGCTLAASRELLTTPTILPMALRCDTDRASIAAGSVLLQPGPPDGTIELYGLVGGSWVLQDSGTGIDELSPHPVPPYSAWSAWPGDAAPYRPPLIAPADPATPTLDIGATLTDPFPTVEALSAAIVDHLAGLAGDPEFPPDVTVVAVEPGGLPLIVVRVEVGGDDSVRGEMVYVWFDPDAQGGGVTGPRIETTYVGQLCWRGGDPESPLCV